MPNGKALSHWGVLGMHWGVTTDRPGSGGGGSSRGSTSHPDHTTVAAIKRKRLHEMSNSEIKILAERMQLEKKYKDLNPGAIEHGRRTVANTMTGLARVAAFTATVITLAGAGKALYNFARKNKSALTYVNVK